VSDEHRTSRQDEWQTVRDTPPLVEDTVHVWLVRVPAIAGDAPLSGEGGAALQQPIAPWASCLSRDEVERARSLREPARSRFVVTRDALRSRLAAYLGCDPAHVGFDYGEMGKPHLRSGGALHFSVAHSGDLALLAFARSAPVGIDLERLRRVPRRERVARRVLARESADALEAVPAAERDRAFIWAWTQREAYVKAVGGGLYRSPDPLPFVWPPRPYESAGWHVTPLPGPVGYYACLVVHGTARSVRLLRMP
jgi:4'-phosphopantetheinyl transferase